MDGMLESLLEVSAEIFKISHPQLIILSEKVKYFQFLISILALKFILKFWKAPKQEMYY